MLSSRRALRNGVLTPVPSDDSPSLQVSRGINSGRVRVRAAGRRAAGQRPRTNTVDFHRACLGRRGRCGRRVEAARPAESDDDVPLLIELRRRISQREEARRIAVERATQQCHLSKLRPAPPLRAAVPRSMVGTGFAADCGRTVEAGTRAMPVPFSMEAVGIVGTSGSEDRQWNNRKTQNATDVSESWSFGARERISVLPVPSSRQIGLIFQSLSPIVTR